MKKITKGFACLLAAVFILAGCNNAEKPVQTSSVAPVSDKQTLVGQWEGKGTFDAYNDMRPECTYLLDFFEDGTMTISSPNIYFYGITVPTVSIENGVLKFTIPYYNAIFTEDVIPASDREFFQITFSLKIGKDELVGTVKQGDWSWGTTFKKIGEGPCAYEEPAALTIEQMTEDAGVLFDILENRHTNIYYVQSQETYEQKKAELLKKLPTMDANSFCYELRRFVSFIGDGHTSVYKNDAQKTEAMTLPIHIDYFSGKWYIIEADMQYEKFLGKEITAINDVPMNDVFKTMSEFTSKENEAGRRNAFRYNWQEIGLLEYLNLAKDGQVSLTIDGKEKITVSAVKVADVDTNKFVKTKSFPETWYQPEKDYFYQPIQDNTLYIQYNACIDTMGYPMTQFSNELAKELNTNTYHKIIIDIRLNGGGFSSVTDILMKPIQEAENKGAKLYCISGSGTFSGGFDLAFNLKKQGALLVGQPTSGNMQHFTNSIPFQLPNSRLSGNYSTAARNYDENAPYDSLYPDVQIDHTIDAYLNGIDEEVEYIKKQK